MEGSDAVGRLEGLAAKVEGLVELAAEVRRALAKYYAYLPFKFRCGSAEVIVSSLGTVDVSRDGFKTWVAIKGSEVTEWAEGRVSPLPEVPEWAARALEEGREELERRSAELDEVIRDLSRAAALARLLQA